MKPILSGDNPKLSNAIKNSEFGNRTRLAAHLGVHYNCIYQYERLQRQPVDQWGYVKYDAAAMCEALGQALEDLFPEGYVKVPYKVRDEDHPARHGPRASKVGNPRSFRDRSLEPDEAARIVALWEGADVVPAPCVVPLAEDIVRRMKPEMYEVFAPIVLEGIGFEQVAGEMNTNTRSIRSRYREAIRFINSPGTLKALRGIKAHVPEVELMPLRDTEIIALQAERERTQVDVAGVLKAIDDPPRKLKPHTVRNWLNRASKSADRSHYSLVLETWRSLPDAGRIDGEALGLGEVAYDGGRVVLNDAIRARLREWQDASGMGAVALLDRARSEGLKIPDGLKHTMILQWSNGAAKSALPDHLAFVAKQWRQAGEARGFEWIPLTDEKRAKLMPLQAAGLLPSRILKDADDVPDGLTPAVISRWLSGKVKRIRKDHLDWVLLMAASRDLST